MFVTDFTEEALLNDLRNINDKCEETSVTESSNVVKDKATKKKESQMKTDEKLVKIFIDNNINHSLS